MSGKQERLAAAVRTEMEKRGVSQSYLMRRTGIPQSTISAILLGKYDVNEEKWRMICEELDLDYDAIVAEAVPLPADDPEEIPCDATPIASSVAQTEEPSCEIPTSDEAQAQDKGQAALVAEYLAAKLKEDIVRGTDMALETLYALLTHVKDMQERMEEK